MAPQTRNMPHAAAADRAAKEQPQRRSTRQHPITAKETTEAEHQLRNGKPRANTIEKPLPTESERPASRAKRSDASKNGTADPAIATRMTRATRHSKDTAAEAPTSQKENVAPKVEDSKRVSQSKKARIDIREPSPPPSKPHISIPPKKRTRNSRSSPTPSISAIATLPAPPQAVATVATITATPKRNLPNPAQTPKPPGTPHSDRNIDKVVFGSIAFKAWYVSYYAKEVLGDISGNNAKMGGGKKDLQIVDKLYICPCCFKYSRDAEMWLAHVRACEERAFVPGEKVYTHPSNSKGVKVPRLGSARESSSPRGKRKRSESVAANGDAGEVEDKGEWSVWEVDGEKEGLFCQNLSLFAKLFLDNKSVFFDVTGFNYFLLVYTPPPASSTHPTPLPLDRSPTDSNDVLPPSIYPSNVTRPQIVGFFSKEKMSWDNNNLACILVFPPWQRKGLGSLLMGVSYEISRREGIMGGPEKPISKLGKLGYSRFWTGEITRWLLGLDVPAPVAGTRLARVKEREKEREKEECVVDIEKCSRETWIAPEDCLTTLRDMGCVEEAGLGLRVPRAKVEAQAEVVNLHSLAHFATGKDKDAKENGNGNGSGPAMVPRVKIDKNVVRRWALENKVDVSRACDPNGFTEGYAVKTPREEEDEV
ncbi:acyl-CoA N-acyltransferase [Xylariaceae sp. FL1019]|nr:acyl-CoA N-acyltransferase [Xylariaceae sp. FL1019]